MTSPGVATATAQTPGEGKTQQANEDEEKEEDQVQEPDWNLYHALQATQGSMGDLRRLAQESPVAKDPRQEVKDAERLAAGKSGGWKGTVKMVPGVGVVGGTPSQVGTV